MQKTYMDFYSNMINTTQFKRIELGVSQGKLYEVMVGEGDFSYVRGGFSANNSPHNQDPMLLLRALHWFVEKDLITSADVERGIGRLLESKNSFLLGMDYISEYLEGYINNPWFPEHWLKIDCAALLGSIPEPVKSTMSESQKFYIKHFNLTHPRLALAVE